MKFLHRKLSRVERRKLAANSAKLKVAIKKIKDDGTIQVLET